MSTLIFKKQIVTDEQHQPVAVQVNYQNWLKIEQLLNVSHVKKSQRSVDFFANHAPLKSFLEIESTEYVNGLRQSSRILRQGD